MGKKKTKNKIVEAFEMGNNHTTQKLKTSEYVNLDKTLYKWFVKMREEKLPTSGPVARKRL